MKINKDQAYLSHWRNLVFNYKRGSGHMITFLLNRFKWHNFPRLGFVSKFPDHVDIEISSTCNMQCPMCYTITEEFKAKVNRNFMEFDLFKKIVDECVKYHTFSIRLSLRGEPFLHKNVINMIQYAKDQGIKEVSTLTNNLALNPELFKQAMDAGLDWLTISFDGLGKTYEWIRKPASFEDSYEKIKDYDRIKKKHGSIKPVVKIQSVWPAIKDNAQDFFDAFFPYVDDVSINPLVDYLHKDNEIVYDLDFDCPVLYQRLVIGSDGIALLCSNDEFCLFPLGDTNELSLFDIWHGEKINHARLLHKQHKGVMSIAPCKHCYLPRKTNTVIETFGGKKLAIEKYLNREDQVGK